MSSSSDESAGSSSDLETSGDEGEFIEGEHRSMTDSLTGEDDMAEDIDAAVQEFSNMSIQDTQYLSELRMFCHFYQIPYLENNAPKTTRNAAKIYTRMISDGLDLH